ncbi:MAG: hypothetical protein C4K47_04545 [Candidatus Thorarchaeota archaeon]|nr:MAG: hypothetical protein C4K47_04545 [Candidatus Thorarchaeota archaeon]
MPWSFYSVILTFGVFFFSLNVYLFTRWLRHPLASDLWLVGVIIGLVGLVFSVHMVRVHQRELIRMKLNRE